LKKHDAVALKDFPPPHTARLKYSSSAAKLLKSKPLKNLARARKKIFRAQVLLNHL
jgi:hypothetical protein